MTTRSRLFMPVLLAMTLAFPTRPGAAADGAARYSGTVLSVDRTAGVIAIGEVGPWRVKDGQTEITRRTVRVTSATRLVRARRSPEGGASGWPGGFVEVPLTASEIRAGDFVTAEVDSRGEPSTALAITLATPGSP